MTLAAGAGSRWTQGAGVVKALHPFHRFHGRYRNFIEVHLAKSRRGRQACGAPLPHVVTTSYLTHEPIAAVPARSTTTTATRARVYLSRGRSVGLRMIPMARDLRFAWEEMPQQVLDEQAQKVRESLHAALDRLGRERRLRQRLHRQPAAAVPAPGRPLVRGAQPAAQRHAAAAARRIGRS